MRQASAASQPLPTEAPTAAIARYASCATSRVARVAVLMEAAANINRSVREPIVHGVRKAPDEQAPQSAVNDGASLGHGTQ